MSLRICASAEEGERRQRAEQDLDDDLRGPEARVHHEVEAAEGFVGFVDAVDQVEHLEAEIDDEGVKRYCAMVSTQRMSIGFPRRRLESM